MKKKQKRSSRATQPPRHSRSAKKRREAVKFRYQPLDPSKLETRLLELCPGKPGSRIVGSLFTVSLLDNPSFEAISYMWGSPRPTYNISINGDKEFPIGRNLRKALDDLRYPDRPRTLWTDAICINQSDTAEKEHQVKLMRRIYAGARKVCAWIDHSVGPLTDVFDDLQRLGKGVEIGDFYDPAHWYPVAAIFRNPYWRRLWIQQELILAAELDIYCRQQVFNGQELLEFQRRINFTKSRKLSVLAPELRLGRYIDGTEAEEQRPPRLLYGDLVIARRELWKAKERAAKQRPGDKREPGRVRGSLMDLFNHTRGLNMTNPRDRVYGILGIATDTDADDIRVDYSLSVAQTYSQVFQNFINKYDSTAFLCFGGQEYKDEIMERQGTLPSWMPPRTGIAWDEVRTSRAAGGIGAQTASIDPVTSILSIDGILVDRVSSVFDAENMPEQPILELFPMLDQFCRSIRPGSHTRPSYESDDITALLFPWGSLVQHRPGLEPYMPRPEDRLAVIRDIQDAARRVAEDGLSVTRILCGGYTPHDVLTAERRELCLFLSITLRKIRLVGTEGGRLGTLDARQTVGNPGDQVWIISGCPMPVVLRPKTGYPHRFSVVCPMILPGVMDGEAVDGVSGWGTRIELE